MREAKKLRMKGHIIASELRRGYRYKRARKIAFATMNKRGLLHPGKRRRRRR